MVTIYGAIAIAVVVIVGLTAWYMQHQKQARRQALSGALEIVEAPISAQATPYGKSFPTKQAKDQAAIKALSDVASKYSGTEAGDAYNLQLSQKRAETVANFLKTEVVNGKHLANAETRVTSTVGVGSEGATDEAEWRRVEISVAGGEGQNIAAHEFEQITHAQRVRQTIRR